MCYCYSDIRQISQLYSLLLFSVEFSNEPHAHHVASYGCLVEQQLLEVLSMHSVCVECVALSVCDM